MILTYNQKKVLRQSGMCKITYKDMYRKDHELAYCSKGGYFYDITVAKDVKPLEVQMIALIHECGHIALAHVHNDVDQDLKDIDQLCKKYNKPVLALSVYGGPMNFINICMDLQVNAMYLTPENIRLMQACGFPPCTVEGYDVPVLGDYRKYFEPLIQKLPETDSEISDLKDKMQKALQQAQQNKNNPGSWTPGSGSNPMPLPQEFQDLINMPGQNGQLSDEMQKALSDEGYADPDRRAKYGSIGSSAETTVDDATDSFENASDESVHHSQSYGIGKGHSDGPEFGEIVPLTDTNIRQFLSRLLKVSREYQLDSFRHYNHGTRENTDGIMYSSLRRRHQESKTKIAILVDVSGSMDTDVLIKGLSAVKAAQNVISKDSVLVTWDTSKCQEFPVSAIPEHVRSGGGTDMGRGMQYLAEKGFKTIVLYSDLETDMAQMTNLITAKHLDVYTICTDKYDESRITDEMRGFLRLNKAVMITK